MPLMPYISDTKDCLDEFYKVFKVLKVNYAMPASLGLNGTSSLDNKTMVLRAVKKHFQELFPKY